LMIRGMFDGKEISQDIATTGLKLMRTRYVRHCDSIGYEMGATRSNDAYHSD
jgi:hypothetical protein